MSWTSAEQNKLVQIIGWHRLLEAEYPSILNAINNVQQTPNGMMPTADVENQIRAELARIATIETTIDQAVSASIVSEDGKTKLSAANQFTMAIYWGNISVAKICRCLGVHPIGGGYFSIYKKSTPTTMMH